MAEPSAMNLPIAIPVSPPEDSGERPPPSKKPRTETVATNDKVYLFPWEITTPSWYAGNGRTTKMAKRTYCEECYYGMRNYQPGLLDVISFHRLCPLHAPKKVNGKWVWDSDWVDIGGLADAMGDLRWSRGKAPWERRKVRVKTYNPGGKRGHETDEEEDEHEDDDRVEDGDEDIIMDKDTKMIAEMRMDEDMIMEDA
ncbi:hypothetical protein BDZ89DRAFT_1059569 [Hymenopellis radicata]|nr:hypothetical protein BDZ89DRAFT_1059569 [Hymenopellis radicata]